MSATLTDRKATSPSRPPSGGETPHGSRLARWASSWRVSLRMARRDVRRYRGRSILVLVMVTLPIALIVAGLTWAASGNMSAKARIPYTMGSGAAVLYGPADYQRTQGLDGQADYGWGEDQPGAATPIPGYSLDASLTDRARAIGQLVKGTVIPVTTGDFRWTDGEVNRRGYALFTADPGALGPKFELRSGRWPTNNSEVVVTPQGLADGMPADGTVSIRVTLSEGGEATRTLAIVGQANAYYSSLGMPSVVSSQPWDPAGPWDANWIVKRAAPIPWSEVRALNTYGLGVDSRAVLTDPPADLGLPQDVYDEEAAQAASLRTIAAVAGTSLFVITALLVGPAFAVSAGRQRRALALAASNGAETRQLRRSVLAQALLLGVLGVVLGVVVGAAGVGAGLAAWRWHRPATTLGLLNVPVLPIMLVAACGILAALTAALIPSLRLGRLDIVGVMKGQNVSPRLSRVVPIVGALLVALGAAGLAIAVNRQNVYAGMAGTLSLVVGALMFIPLLLVGAGHLSARFPAAIRMATRDSARQRHRTVPTVAAVMAGSALLATFAVSLASDTAFQARDYQPQAPMGEGFMWASPENVDEVRAAIRAVAPQWESVVIQSPGVTYDSTMAEPPEATPVVLALKEGCTPLELLPNYGQSSAETAKRCATFTTDGSWQRGSISVMPSAEIIRRLHLKGKEAAQVAAGTALATAKPGVVVDGAVTMASGTSTINQDSGVATAVEVTRRDRLPVLPLSEAAYAKGLVRHDAGLVVPLETATKLGWSLTMDVLAVFDPAGPISAAQSDAVAARQTDPDAMYIERGFQREDRKIMFGVFALGVFLLTTVTLISTSLALAEQQNDMGTLAAVGATKGTRRRFAGAQAATVALIGSVLGLLIGAIAGRTIAIGLTSSRWDELAEVSVRIAPTIRYPALSLVIVLVGVPLLAALIAMAAIRRAPEVTHRAG